MTVALVQQVSTTSANPGTMTISLPSAGHLLVIVAGTGNSGAVTRYYSAVSGGGVTTWRFVQTGNGNWFGAACDIWWGFVDGTPSTTITLTNDGGEWFAQTTVAEFSGLAVVTSLDGSGTSSTPGKASSLATPSITPSQAGDLFIASGGCGSGGGLDASFSSGSAGWSNLGVTGRCGFGQYLIASDGSAESDTFTMSSANENLVAAIAAFKQPTVASVGWGVIV